MRDLIKANTLYYSILMYGITLLKPYDGNIVDYDEYLLKAMTVDFASVGRRMKLSDITLKRCIAYLVSINAIVKTGPYKSRLYLINLHFYNGFNRKFLPTLNDKFKTVFEPVLIP